MRRVTVRRWRTGYGSTEALFARAHVYANLLRYPRWVLETETPFVLLALGAPFVLRRDPARARLAWVSLAATALLLATYLAYTVFDDWWYIRFLLPAIPAAPGVESRRVAAVDERAARRGCTGGTRDGCGAARGGRRLRRARTSRDRTADARVAIRADRRVRRARRSRRMRWSSPVQQSGSIRFHGRRDTIAWDAIAPDAARRDDRDAASAWECRLSCARGWGRAGVPKAFFGSGVRSARVATPSGRGWADAGEGVCGRWPGALSQWRADELGARAGAKKLIGLRLTVRWRRSYIGWVRRGPPDIF